MKKYYDKMLHILGCFTALAWLSKANLPFWVALIIVILLCVSKTIWNYLEDKNYRPYGDWIANAIGIVQWFLYTRV